MHRIVFLFQDWPNSPQTHSIAISNVDASKSSPKIEISEYILTSQELAQSADTELWLGRLKQVTMQDRGLIAGMVFDGWVCN